MLVVVLILASVCLYFALVVTWLCTSAEHPRRRFALGLTAILSAAPFFIWVGMFGSIFEDNLCYSNTFADLVRLPEQYAKVDESTAVQRFTVDTKMLPNHGYETRCSDLHAAVVDLLQRSGAVDLE
jgi:hypothetical protein